MEVLTNNEKEIYLSVFHDVLLWEIRRLEDKSGDQKMWAYQISILGNEDPKKFALKIKELKTAQSNIAEKQNKYKKKIDIMNEELKIYEKHLERIRRSNNKKKGGDKDE